jgi:hypothetical protein
VLINKVYRCFINNIYQHCVIVAQM